MRSADFARAARHIAPEAARDTLMETTDIAGPIGCEGELAKHIVTRAG